MRGSRAGLASAGTITNGLGPSTQPAGVLFGQGAVGAYPGIDGATIVGRDDNAGRFVGDQRAQQLGQGATSNRSRTNQNSRNRNRNRQGANTRLGNNRNGSSEERTRSIIRPRQKIAFTYPVREAREVNLELSVRIARVSRLQNELNGVEVAVDDAGVATLNGVVDSPEQKRLAEIFVRLEPGVRSISNQLTVQAETVSP
jgi:hypothetical protein